MNNIAQVVKFKQGWAIKRAGTIGSIIYTVQDVAHQVAGLEVFEYELADILYHNNEATIH